MSRWWRRIAKRESSDSAALHGRSRFDDRRTPRRRFGNAWSIVGILFLLSAATLPIWISGGNRAYVLNLAILIGISAIGGISFNLLGGYAGQISFGHAAFYGVGAYSFARFFDSASIEFFPALTLAALFTAIVSLPVGWVLLRLSGAYFALSMLAYAEVLRLIAQVWRPVTNGAAGYLFPSAFTDRAIFYWVTFGVALLCLAMSWLILQGRPGAYLLAIREDQDVAASLGIPVHRLKVFAFFVSAFFMGLAGAMYAAYFAYLEPGIVFNGLTISLSALIVTLIGGIGTLMGPVVGAIILSITTEASIIYLGDANLLAAGVLLVAVILMMPEGVVGSIQARLVGDSARVAHAATETKST